MVASLSMPPRVQALLLLAITATLALSIAAMVGRSRQLLLATIFIDLPLQWDFNIGYNDSAAQLGAYAGFNISLTTLALVGLYGMWLVDLLHGRRTTSTYTARSAIPMVVFLTIIALSILVAGDRQLGADEMFLLLQLLLLYCYLVETLRTEAEFRFILTLIVAGLLLESVLIIMSGLGGHTLAALGVATHTTTSVVSTQARVTGTLGAANSAGIYLSGAIVIAATLLVGPFGRWAKRTAAVAIALALVALVLTFSRGGWLGLVVGLLILGVVGQRRGFIRSRTVVTVVGGAAIVLLPFAGLVVARLTGSDAGSAAARLPLIQLALHMIEAHPLAGVGANNFGLALPSYAASPDFAGVWLYTVHNKFLLIAAESGIFALAAFIWMLIAVARRSVGPIASAHPLLGPATLGLLAALAGQVVQMMVEPYNGRPSQQMLWTIAALITAAARITRAAPASVEPASRGASRPRRKVPA